MLDSFVASIRSAVRQNGGKGNHARAWNGDGRCWKRAPGGRGEHADKVLKVSLSVGEMTEAIEDALTFAYEAITDNDPLFSGSKLDITMVPPKSRCVECGHEFTHDRFHVMCPECGGFADLIEGKELRIDSIEVDIPDENEE